MFVWGGCSLLIEHPSQTALVPCVGCLWPWLWAFLPFLSFLLSFPCLWVQCWLCFLLFFAPAWFAILAWVGGILSLCLFVSSSILLLVFFLLQRTYKKKKKKKSTLHLWTVISLLLTLSWLLDIQIDFKFAKLEYCNSSSISFLQQRKISCLSNPSLWTVIDTICCFSWNSLAIAFDLSVSLIQYQLLELFWTWWQTGCLPSKFQCST